MLHTILIALATIGGVTVLLIALMAVTRRQKRRKMEKLQQEYQQLIEANNLNPSYSQVFDHRILALDSKAGAFIFAQHDPQLPHGIIHLSEVQNCSLWKDGISISRSSKTNKSTTEEYINTIGLAFQRKGNNKPIHVPIYSEVLDGVLEKIPLHNIAEQWQLRIKNELDNLRMQHANVLA